MDQSGVDQVTLLSGWSQQMFLLVLVHFSEHLSKMSRSRCSEEQRALIKKLIGEKKTGEEDQNMKLIR